MAPGSMAHTLIKSNAGRVLGNALDQTGCRALVYDRYGYGQSDVLEEPRRSVRFMHDEALVSLPDLRRKLGIDDAVLVGHSDGASIAPHRPTDHGHKATAA